MKVQLLTSLAAVLLFCMMAYVHIGLEVRFDINLDVNVSRPCACNRCIVEPNEDKWFTDRFRSDVPIMLNSKNYNLSGSTKKWWMRLQRRNRGSNKNYYVIKDALFSLFPDKEYYNDSSHERCRTCAVVGNSANLNGSMYGPLIDAHDFVLRMNRGPTKGFEKDVGSRTTHRAMYPVSAMDVDNSTHMVLLPFSVRDMEWLISAFTTKHINRLIQVLVQSNTIGVKIFSTNQIVSWEVPLLNYIEKRPYPVRLTGELPRTHTAVRASVEANKDMVMIINPGFMRYVHGYWLRGKGRIPSTGLIMLVLSLHICDQVNVFGFGADMKGRWLHYFDTSHHPSFNNGNHKGGFEHSTILELHKKKKITLFRGW